MDTANTFALLLLALVQGITEFLPISGSAHLVITADLVERDGSLDIAIALHAGTLLAVIAYMRTSVADLILGTVRRDQAALTRLVRLITATFPLVLVGGLLYSIVEDFLHTIISIALANAVFAGWLAYADSRASAGKHRATDGVAEFPASNRDALLVGLAQCCAIIPGASRSGVTMSAAMMLGADRKQAAHFSLLLSMPAIAGSSVLAIAESSQTLLTLPNLIGGAIAAVVAFLSINAMMRLIDRVGYTPFVWYRLLLSLVLMGWYFGSAG